MKNKSMTISGHHITMCSTPYPLTTDVGINAIKKHAEVVIQSDNVPATIFCSAVNESPKVTYYAQQCAVVLLYGSNETASASCLLHISPRSMHRNYEGEYEHQIGQLTQQMKALVPNGSYVAIIMGITGGYAKREQFIAMLRQPLVNGIFTDTEVIPQMEYESGIVPPSFLDVYYNHAEKCIIINEHMCRPIVCLEHAPLDLTTVKSIALTFPQYSQPENCTFVGNEKDHQATPYGSFNIRMSGHDVNLWQKMFTNFFVLSDTRKSLGPIGGDESTIEYTAYVMNITAFSSTQGIIISQKTSAFGSSFTELARWKFAPNSRKANCTFLIPNLENRRENSVGISIGRVDGFYDVTIKRYAKINMN